MSGDVSRDMSEHLPLALSTSKAKKQRALAVGREWLAWLRADPSKAGTIVPS